MARHPIAYVRRSAPGASLSYQEQREAVRRLAEQHGDADALTELVDAGKSGAAALGSLGGTGRGTRSRRHAYAELREQITSGQVSAVYAYSLSRLARSTRELLDLAESMAAHGTALRLAKEGAQDFGTPAGRLFVSVLAAVATFEAEVHRDRTADRIAGQRERGEYVGRQPFGYRIEAGQLAPVADEQAIIRRVHDAYATAQTLEATAKALNASGLASPTGGTWQPTTVRRILARSGALGPPDRRRAGSRIRPVAMFARLMYCATCGGLLSPARKQRPSGEWIGYRCAQSRYDPRHGSPGLIAEAAVRSWAEGEAARLRVPYDMLERRTGDETARQALAERRQRVVELFVSGSIPRAEYDGLVADVDARLAAADARAELVAIPPAVDWSGPPEAIQPVLAALWERVTVDLPARAFVADWRVPEWRS